MASPMKTLEDQCGAYFSSPTPSDRAKLRRSAESCLATLATARLDMVGLTSFVELLPSLVALSGTPSYDKALLNVYAIVLKLLSGFPLSDLPETVVSAMDASMASLFQLLRSPNKWVSSSSSPSTHVVAAASGAGRHEDGSGHFGESPHVVMVSAAVLHDAMDWLVPLQSSLVVETNWHAWMSSGADGDAAVLRHMTRWLEQAASRQMYQAKGKKLKEDDLNTNAELRVHIIRLARSLVCHPCSRAIAAGTWYSLVVCVASRIGEPHYYRRDGLVCVEALRFLTLLGESGPLSRDTWVGILERVVVRVYPTRAEEALSMVTATMEKRRQSWEAFGTHYSRQSLSRVISATGALTDLGGAGDAEADIGRTVSSSADPSPQDGQSQEAMQEEDAEPMRTKDGLPLYFSEGMRASFDLLLAGLTVPGESLDAAAVGSLVGPLNALLSISVHVLSSSSPSFSSSASSSCGDLFYCVSKVFAPQSRVPDTVLTRLYRALCASTRFLVNTVTLLTQKLHVACWHIDEPASLALAVRCMTSLCEVLTWVLVAVLEEHRNSTSAGVVACAPAHKVNERLSKSLSEVEAVVASFFYRLTKGSVLVDFYTEFIKAHLLNLLLAFVTDAVTTVGVADDGAWLHSTRQQSYQVAAAVDRCVDKCVQRSPTALVTEVAEKLDGVSQAVAPFVHHIRSLLPHPDAKRLAPSGATRLFDVICDSIILF